MSNRTNFAPMTKRPRNCLLTILLIVCLTVSSFGANVLVDVRTISSGAVRNRRVTVTLVEPGPVALGNWVFVGDSVTQFTATNGTTTFSNLLTLGSYRLDVAGAPSRSFLFCVSSTNGTWNVTELFGDCTTNQIVNYYTADQIDALVFGTNYSTTLAASLTNNDTRTIALAGGSLTIGGRLLATNTVANGGTNYIAGMLRMGEANSFPSLGTETLYINSRATNPIISVPQTRSYLSVGYTFANSNLIHNGIQSVARVATNNTADWTDDRYPQLSAFEGSIQPEIGSAGTIRRSSVFSATVAGPFQGNGATQQEVICFWGDAAQPYHLGHFVGYKQSDLNAGINNTGIWLGLPQDTYTQDGNWAIWDETGYPSRFSGNVSSVGVFYGDGSGLSNLPSPASFWYTNSERANSITNAFDVGIVGKLSVGSASSTNKLDVVSGTLSTNMKAFSLTGTLAGSSSTESGAYFGLIGGGVGANLNQALSCELLAGYTGSGFTIAGQSANFSLSTGAAAWSTTVANYGFLGSASGAGVGNNMGIQGRAIGSSTLNLALSGRAVSSSGSATFNVAVAGQALNASTANIAGFFGLMNVAPSTLTSAALMADNGAVAAPIFVARDNGTEVFRIDDGGAVQAVALTATNFLMLPTNYVAASFVPVAGMVKFCSSNGAVFSVTQISTNLIAGP